MEPPLKTWIAVSGFCCFMPNRDHLKTSKIVGALREWSAAGSKCSPAGGPAVNTTITGVSLLFHPSQEHALHTGAGP